MNPPDAGPVNPLPTKLRNGPLAVWAMDPRSALLLGLALITTSLAGCIGATDDALDPASLEDDVTGQAYVPIATGNLSQPVHDILPRVTERVQMSVGDIDIFVEYWLPDGEGPWPTIVHSTPYSHLDRGLQATGPATGIQGDHAYFVPRGYAYVVADVRGFGESEGCVEVWGENEQQDQADLVEWVAEQAWSDGNVGMIGASYPGTTPMEAAVQAPEPLKAIVAVAGLTDPYYDWHFGGVPNGESGPVGSPAAYQGIGSVVPLEAAHGTDWAESAADTGCGTAELVTEAYQSDGLYTDFYAERNLSARVDQVQAATLYTQGFQDGNVKPSQMLRWFNALDAPKKGIFGPWGHQFPPREDMQNLTLAWFDEHLKGIDTRVMDGPTVEVHTNLDTWRADQAFPSNLTDRRALFATEGGSLAWDPSAEGSLQLDTGRAQATVDATLAPATGQGTDKIVLRTEPLEEDLYLSGQTRLAMQVSLDGAENAFLWAELNEVTDDESNEVTFGALNLALREDVTRYEPMPLGETVDATLRFQPVEHVFEAGTVLELVLEPVEMSQSDTPEAAGPSTLTLQLGGQDGTRLLVPLLDGRPDTTRPDDV